MKIKSQAQFGFFTLRLLVALSLCLAGLALAVFAFHLPAEPAGEAEDPPATSRRWEKTRKKRPLIWADWNNFGATA